MHAPVSLEQRNRVANDFMDAFDHDDLVEVSCRPSDGRLHIFGYVLVGSSLRLPARWRGIDVMQMP